MSTGRGEQRIRNRIAGLGLSTLACAALCVSLPAPTRASAQLDPGPPSIEAVSATSISSKRATLKATINPDGLDTTYEFWVAYAVCQNVPPGHAECEAIAVRPVGEGQIAAGASGDTVSTDFTHLEPAYLYSYWVIASNSLGKPQSATQAFRALPAPAIDSETVSGLAPNPIELGATIDPLGQAVRYQFQLVADPSEYAPEIACPEPGAGSLICVGTHLAGALPIGFLPANCGPQAVALNLDQAGLDLKVGSTYHYRVIVAPSVQTEDTLEWEGPPTVGADESFTVGEDNVTPLRTPPPPVGSGDGSNQSTSGQHAPGMGGSTPIEHLRPLALPKTKHKNAGKGAHHKHKRHKSEAVGHKRHGSKSSRHGRRKKA
ncbi:MAG TPA: hypothetical protein VIG42_07250 [Solirubrobacteraceae bacterium]|jgi:hypothetical protein